MAPAVKVEREVHHDDAESADEVEVGAAAADDVDVAAGSAGAAEAVACMAAAAAGLYGVSVPSGEPPGKRQRTDSPLCAEVKAESI